MLYINTWDRKSVRELLTVENLVAWLKTQNPKTKYFYVNGSGCLIAKYLRDNGYTNATAGVTHIRISGEIYGLPTTLNDISNYDKPLFSRRTFGGALKKAEKYLGQRSEVHVKQP